MCGLAGILLLHHPHLLHPLPIGSKLQKTHIQPLAQLLVLRADMAATDYQEFAAGADGQVHNALCHLAHLLHPLHPHIAQLPQLRTKHLPLRVKSYTPRPPLPSAHPPTSHPIDPAKIPPLSRAPQIPIDPPQILQQPHLLL